MASDLTAVSLSYRKRRRNHRLLFGSPAQTVRLDWQRSLAVFKPGQVFAYERWRGGKYGTIEWRIFILKAASRCERVDVIHGVNPGAHLLADAQGKTAAKTMLACLDEVQGLSVSQRSDATFWQRLSLLRDLRLDPEIAARLAAR